MSADHYREAERLLRQAKARIYSDPSSGVERELLAAQVHATLAMSSPEKVS